MSYNKVDKKLLSYISKIGEIRIDKYSTSVYSGKLYVCALSQTKFLRFLADKDITHLDCLPFDNCKVASIGFSEKEQKWYGWSHRAIYGFGIGYIAKDGDSCTTSGWTDDYLKEHPERDLSVPVGFEVKTLEDAKKVAIAFAESVS